MYECIHPPRLYVIVVRGWQLYKYKRQTFTILGFNSSVGRAQGWKLWGRWFESILEHLNLNYKLFFKYLFFNLTHLYLTHSTHGSKNISVVIPQNLLYYSSLHLRFSTVFYSSQLVDIFAYELPLANSTSTSSSTSTPFSSNTIAVYNFHNLTFQERFFLFCVDSSPKFSSFRLNSVAELYPNASWLEREVSEFHGIVFNNKKDLRNLMLQYGDTSAPFQKSSPTIGVKEVFYDSVNDILIQSPISLQV